MTRIRPSVLNPGVLAPLALIAVVVLMALWPVRAQVQPGRILVTPRSDIIPQCNLNGSNCLNVTGSVQADGETWQAARSTPTARLRKKTIDHLEIFACGSEL